MPSIGPLELVVLLVIVLLIFGPKRLPGLGRQLGTGMREFKDSITGKDSDEDDDEPRQVEPARAPAAPQQPIAEAQPAAPAAPANEQAEAAFGAGSDAPGDGR